MTEQDLLLDCLQRLNRSGVEYMLTGSMASNYWGIPRTTHDLDFVVQLPQEAVGRLIHEFDRDFYLDEAAVRAALGPPYQFNAIDLRSALKVDFWVLKRDLFEEGIFERRLRTVLFGEPSWIATAEDVILHKLRWDTITPSERQLGDAAGIVAVQADRLDLVHLRRWAARLGVTGTMEDLLAHRIRPKGT